MTSKIDWDFWLAFPEIRAWQAVALSLDMDPDKMDLSSTAWMRPTEGPIFLPTAFPSHPIRDEFLKRLRLLTASLSDRRHFTAGTLTGRNANYNGVQLIQVAAWLKSLGRTPIATKLLEAIQTRPGAITSSASHSEQNGATETLEATRHAMAKMAWMTESSKIGLAIQAKMPSIKREAVAAEIWEALEKTPHRGKGGKLPSIASIMRHGLDGLTFKGNARNRLGACSNAPKNTKR